MFRDLSEESVSRSFGRKCFQTFRVKVFQKKMHFRGEYVSDPGRICLVENATKHDLSIFALFAFPHFCISTAFCGHYNPKGGQARPWPDISQRTRDIYICAGNLTIHTQHQPPHAPKSKIYRRNMFKNLSESNVSKPFGRIYSCEKGTNTKLR